MNKWIIFIQVKGYIDWNINIQFSEIFFPDKKKYSKYSLHVSFVVPKLLLVKRKFFCLKLFTTFVLICFIVLI